MAAASSSSSRKTRNFGQLTGWILAGGGACFLLYLALTAKSGIPDPEAADNLSYGSVVVNTGLLVAREGLEAVLVLAAVTASFVGANRHKRRPVATGAGVACMASVVTWFLAVFVINILGGPGLDIQAATGLLAIIVLLVVMNWFFHKVYWTGWIAHHHRRRRDLLGGSAGKGLTFGLLLLGFTAVYREGFEIVLFVQNLRLKYGTVPVLEGVAIGLAFTAAIGVITFVAHHKLPYKRMLVLTGALIGFVLIVMVGESMQELQLAGWIPTTNIGVTFPGWVGTWLAVFPSVETLGGQAVAGIAVVGSYLVAERRRVRRPVRSEQIEPLRGEEVPAMVRFESSPSSVAQTSSSVS